MVFFIPGVLIGLITFPGVMLHEYLHKKMCNWQKVKVYDVKYFTWESEGLFSDGMGYVKHAKTSFWKQTKIGLAPLLAFFPGIFLVMLSSFMLESENLALLSLLLLWIGFSFLANMFPSRADLEHYFKESPKKNLSNKLISLFLTPIMILLYIFSYLEVVWADFIVAIIIILSVFGGMNYVQYGEFDNPNSVDDDSLSTINESILQSKILEKINTQRQANGNNVLLYDKYKTDLNKFTKNMLANGAYGYGDYEGYSGTIPYYFNVEGCGSTMSNDKMAECIVNDLPVNDFYGNFISIAVSYDKYGSEVKYAFAYD